MRFGRGRPGWWGSTGRGWAAEAAPDGHGPADQVQPAHLSERSEPRRRGRRAPPRMPWQVLAEAKDATADLPPAPVRRGVFACPGASLRKTSAPDRARVRGRLGCRPSTSRTEAILDFQSEQRGQQLDLGAVPPITRQSRRYRREEMILSWLSGIGGDAVLVTNPLHNWSPTSRPARRNSVSATVGGEDRTIRHSHSQRQSLSGASRSTSQDRRRGSSCKILCCCSRGYHTGRRPPRTRSACRTPLPRLVSLLPNHELKPRLHRFGEANNAVPA